MERLDQAVQRVLADLRSRMDEEAGGVVEAPPVSAARRGSGFVAREGENPGCDAAIPARRFVVHPKGGDRALTGRPGGQRR